MVNGNGWHGWLVGIIHIIVWQEWLVGLTDSIS